jgi:hypothetical protein
MVWWAWLSGCDKLKGATGAAEPTPEQCAPICAASAPPAPPPDPNAPAPPTDFEKQILDSVLVDIRKGVQPWDDTAIGICKGRKDCDKFLGVAPGALGRGAHFVKAELRVPPGPPGTWKVKFETNCKTPTGEERSFEREYDVQYNGPDTPFRLWPLRPIESPSPEGAEACTWTLTTHDPTGDRQYTGNWSVTGK